jgi:Ala-tRNA(Pro) deacylase
MRIEVLTYELRAKTYEPIMSCHLIHSFVTSVKQNQQGGPTMTHLEEYLKREQVEYRRIIHSRAYTAQKTAAYAHISGKEIAKTVMIKIDGRLCMAVIPASGSLDTRALKEASGAKEVRLATEPEFKDNFPDCEVGAMPPFGNLYNMDVFVSTELTQDPFISFNACNHSELIQISYKDYQRLVNPVVLDITYHPIIHN